MTAINQKEYLKRYLSGKKEKKKHKKKPTVTDRVNIIDDDIDISTLTSLEAAADLLNTNEDAPQVVGVIDDRPMHLRVNDYRNELWKPLAAQDNSNEQPSIAPPQKEPGNKINMSIVSKYEKRPDESPPRKKPNRKRVTRFDESPPRRKDFDNTPNKGEELDATPPHTYANSPARKSDSSPPRRSRKESDSSPPRRNRKDSDSSPPRKRNVDNSPPRRNKKDSDNSPPRKRNVDSSPPRRSRKDPDNSPPRKNKRNNDRSPPRRNKRDPERKSSPPRRNRSNSDNSPLRKQIKQEIESPPRPSSSKVFEPPQRKLLPGNKKGKYLIPAKRADFNTEKMTKTLDGKTAGLQNKHELVKENEEFVQRESEAFKNMPADISGANATPIMRDRKTGKIRDLQQEAEERKEKEKREEENKEKYSRWGRGLKQVEAYEDKLSEDLHEMNKPLARYADDEDLERYLKEQEREGDPMLAYIRKKKKKKVVESGKPLKPQYEGEFNPNRFGIVPGYRWDGVDRSNGYEKKWFQVQNAKRAEQEEIYKWSTEDM